MRLFLAIELPEDVRAVLTSIQRAWPPEVNRSYAPTRPENIHITLKFLGETPDAQLSALCSALERVPAFSPIPLVIDRMIFFPPRSAPRIVAAGPALTPAPLIQLHQAIESACAPLGYAPEGRAYHAHATLARGRRPWSPARNLIEQAARDLLPAPPLQITQFALLQSELLPKGPRYTTLARLPLRTEP